VNWIEANGVALRYDLAGAGPNTLVLIHEMGGTLDSWDDVLPVVSRTRRALRYDTRGAGQSEKIRGKVSFDIMAEDLAALLDALDITGAVSLAGVAVGAGIALNFAARFPSRVAAIVAMGPATGITPDRREATLARSVDMETNGPRAQAEASFANAYPPVVRHDAEQYRKFRTRWLANDARSYAAINRMLAYSDVTEKLPAITAPTLMLAGIHDALRPPAIVEPLSRLMPNAQFRALDTAHYMAVQTPALVAETIEGFLAPLGL
jgi:3-oxoadipate enol-lactonase